MGRSREYARDVHSGQVFQALRAKYGASAVVVAEVPNATGHSKNARRLDAVAIGCWPSRGLYYHGIEIKVSRHDLRRELATPEKAEAIGVCCDRFFLACPKGMCDPDELPEAWGLYEYSKGKIRLKKQPSGHAVEDPNRRWFAALIRAVVEQQSDEAVLEKARSQARSEAWREAKDHYEQANEKLYQEAQAAQEALSRYETLIGGYRGTVTPEKLRVVLRAIDSLKGHYGALNSLRASAREIVKEADVIEEIAKSVFEFEPREDDDGSADV